MGNSTVLTVSQWMPAETSSFLIYQTIAFRNSRLVELGGCWENVRQKTQTHPVRERAGERAPHVNDVSMAKHADATGGAGVPMIGGAGAMATQHDDSIDLTN